MIDKNTRKYYSEAEILFGKEVDLITQELAILALEDDFRKTNPYFESQRLRMIQNRLGVEYKKLMVMNGSSGFREFFDEFKDLDFEVLYNLIEDFEEMYENKVV